MESQAQEIGGMRLAGLSLAVAAVLVGAGLLGLQWAAPPGYASPFWPASGLALATLLIFSPRLVGGVFLGVFVVSAHAGGAFGAGPVDGQALAVAAVIATALSLQTIISAYGMRCGLGTPVRFSSVRDVAIFVGLLAPLASLLTASAGTLALSLSGLLPQQALAGYWLSWWLGEWLGLVVIVLLVLLGPWRHWTTGWTSTALMGLRTASLIALLIPLTMTFYGWKWTSDVGYQRGYAAFEALTRDSEQALLHRLDTYSQGLNGAIGLFQASDAISADDWRAYVEALNIGVTMPGISGMGVIDDVPAGQLDVFLAGLDALGVERPVMHPLDGHRGNHFIVRYIEPLAANRASMGLDIAIEANRRQAAIAARNNGVPTITRRVFLMQDNTLQAGFLLLKPLYRQGLPLDTALDRNRAFRAWVFAPFIGARFMEDLTSSQGDLLDIAVYDGTAVDETQLIFDSRAEAAGSDKAASNYSITRTVSVMGQFWTVVWNSTERFDQRTTGAEPLFVLLAGLAVSGLFGAFLFTYARREQTVRHQVVRQTREIMAREQENRAVVNTAVVGILLLDDQGNILSANEAALDIFGVEPSDVAEMSIRNLLQLTSGETVAEILDAFPSSPAARVRPVSGINRHGEALDLEVQLNPWTTEDGHRRYTAIVRDVTLQRRVTVALEDAEQRWSNALRGARIGVFDLNLTTGRSIVSDTWKTMLGFHIDDVIEPQSEWLARVHPDDLPLVQAADEACFFGLVPRSESEYRIRHKSGQWIWLRSDAVVTERDENGRALQLVGTQTDITALKEAETALRFSEERLRSAIEHAPIGMVLVGADGSWISANDALFNFLGYTAEEFYRLELADMTHPEDSGSDSELIARLVSGEIADYQLEKRYLHKEGHALWGLLSVSVARDGDGEIAYFIAQIQDIQDRKEMERIKNEFVSNVSHELRTPLTSIRGSLGLVVGAMAHEVPDAVMRLLRIAHKNSERLILLVNDILDLEKMNSERLHFAIGTHALRDEVLLAIDTNQSYASQFDVDLVLDTPEMSMACDFDPARLQQVLANLLSNAAKFSPRGGAVHLSLSRVGKMARVSIADSGPGIPASFRGRIFSPFSQADASATRETGGTGLGLHIAKQMMEKMAGSLDYSSTEGSGSTFWIDLPLSVAERVENTQQNQPLHLPRVLHVEDDADFRSFIATALAGQLHIVQAASLSEARAHLDNLLFDVILLDLQLPDGNGTALLEGLSIRRGCPVVVLTATESMDGDHPGADVTLVKSRTPEDVIVARILEAAASSRRSQAARQA